METTRLAPDIGGAPLREVYTVSRLNAEAKRVLEAGLPGVWLEGEISNLARPVSGHLYFCLKDAHAQVRCALFRGQARNLTVEPRDGMLVLVRARVSLYEPRGEFQLIVEQLEEAGEGALRRAFEALKAKLAAEGLFELARKRPLPRLPRRIGVVTSLGGAVLHDILTTLRRRFPSIPVLVYPVPVQGAGAAEKIAAAIRVAGERAECDALILARGGGSLEDLWAFNEEIVARAIAGCPVPIVCGVGHETDVTIADFVADARAPTPTAAAEMLSPNRSEWLQAFAQLEARITRLIREALRTRAQSIDWLGARVLHPHARLRGLHDRLDGLAHRLFRATHARLDASGHALAAAAAGLQRHSPAGRVRSAQLHCTHLHHRLRNAFTHGLASRRQRLHHAAQTLHALSPLATLDRGYAIVTDAAGTVVRDARAVNREALVTTRLARGRLVCRVEEQHEK